MEFRSYFVIASMNPPTIYGYNVALIKQCAVEFSLRDFTKQGHVCNTAITKSHKQETGNKNEEELYIDWNLEELQDLLLSQGRINSTTWLKDYLLPQIYRKVTHLFLSVKDMLLQDSRVGEFFGVDFIMDDDLRLWIFEANRNPNFLAVTQGRKDKFYTLIQDMIEIEWQYVKSKYKRIREFVLKNLQSFEKDSSPVQKNKLKREFLELQTDRLEPEFELKHNRLELIFRGEKSLGKNQSKYLNHECLLD